MNRSRITGDLVSQNNIFVDIVNDRVGIGGTVPTHKLDVVGSTRVGGFLEVSDSLRVGGQFQNSQTIASNQGVRINRSGSRPCAVTFDHGGSPTLELGCNTTESIIGTNSNQNKSLVVKTGMNLGTLTGGTTRFEFRSNGDIRMPVDNQKLQLGENQDLEILHDPSNGIIRSINSGGNMHVESKNHIELNVNYNPSTGSKENALKAIANSGVGLYFNGLQKFSTTAYGINVNGTTETDGLVVSGVSTFSAGVNCTSTSAGAHKFGTGATPTTFAVTGQAEVTIGGGSTKDNALAIESNTTAGADYDSNIVLARSRGTHANKGLVQVGDFLGRVGFYGYDGSEYERAAEIAAVVSAGTGTNDMPTQLQFKTTPNGQNVPTTKLIIHHGGNIEIPNDYAELQLGNDQDLRLYHNGIQGKLDNHTGKFKLRSNAIKLTNLAESYTYIECAPSGQQDVELFYDNSVKFQTTSTGISVTGGAVLTSTDAGSAAGPEFKLYRNSASPADADYLGQIKFAGESDTGVERNYAKITGKILDASNGTEDGIIEFAHIKAGSQVITGRWRSDSLQLLNGTNLSVAGTSTFSGDITVDSGTSSTIRVEADSGGEALFLATGGSGAQATAAIELMQSTTSLQGGGISYNGDGSPAWASGESSDTITFYRRRDGNRHEVFSYPYSGNDVTFNGDILPELDGAKNLGSNTVRFNAVYADKIYGSVQEAITSAVTIDLNGTDNGATTFLTLDHYIADISDEYTWIDFTFRDSNSNATPQLKIGAQAGDTGAGSQISEGTADFVVQCGVDNSASANTMTEMFRVSHENKIISVNHHPQSDSNFDLGTNTVRWRNVYADTLYIGNAINNGVVLAGITTSNSDITVPTSMDSTESGGVAIQRFWNTGTITAGNVYKCGKWYTGEGTVQLLIAVRSHTAGNSGTTTYMFQGSFSAISSLGIRRLMPLTVGTGHGDGPDRGIDSNAWEVLIKNNNNYTYELYIHVPAGRANKHFRVTVTEVGRGLNFTDISSTVAYSSLTVQSSVILSSNYNHLGHTHLRDNYAINLGNDDDLQIYHSPNSSYIDNNTNHLFIRNNVDGDDGGNIYLQALSGENSIICNDDGAVELYHDNTKMFSTESRGAILQKADTCTLIIGSTNAGGAQIFFDGDSNGDGNGGDYAAIRHTSTGDLSIEADNPGTSAEIQFKTGNGSHRSSIDASGHFKPASTTTYDIGLNSVRWRNIYNSGLISNIFTNAATSTQAEFRNEHSVYGGGVRFKSNNTYGTVEIINYNGTASASIFNSTGGWHWTGNWQTHGNVLPFQDSSHTLGTSSKRWSHIYGDAITLTGTAAIERANTLRYRDLRNVAPADETTNMMRFYFTSWGNSGNTSGYADGLHMRSYGDSSGGSDNLVVWYKNGFGMRQFQQSFGSSTDYSNYAQYFHGQDHAIPQQNNTFDLGSTSYRWRNLYTQDLQLSNEAKKEEGGNDVDGTWGDWTLQEGENDIFMINNRTGKKFAIIMREVS